MENLNNENINVNEGTENQETKTYSQEEVLALKNKRICENCYVEIALSSKYCPHCGFEQPEEAKEDIKEDAIDDKNTVEIVEEDNNEE